MIKELDTAILTRDLSEYGLRKGDIGTVVLVHANGAAYEVEFTTLSADTLAVITLPADAVRAGTARDMPHAREMA